MQAAGRRTALDWMRGFVMVLMAVDHSSIFFNSGRIDEDSAATYVHGSALPLGQFLTRWMTHLCAPTFLFLAGAALALSTDRRKEKGQSDWQIDRDLLTRGAIIALLDVCYMSILAQHLMLQVLYAIGVSMIVMVPLRRLPDRWLLALSLGWFVAGEALTGLLWRGHGDVAVPTALTLAPHSDARVWIIYPFVPWLAIMMLGWVFGRNLCARERRGAPAPIRSLLVLGAGSLALFVIVRKLGGYGNMFLPADDGSLAQWLHVSKYPPALAFVSLELGLMALVLAGFMALEGRVAVSRNSPLLVFGQTALFFYLLHFTLLGISGQIAHHKAGLGLTYAVALTVVVGLYPLCRWYRGVKQARPGTWLRFI